MAVGFNFLTQIFGADALDSFFAGGVYRHHHQNIGLIKCPAEFIQKGLGAAVPMGLKHHHLAPIRPVFFNGLQSDFNLCRMVPVVIDDGDTIGLAFDLQAALDTFNGFKGSFDLIKADIELDTDGNTGRRIVDIVYSGQV